MLDDRRVGQAHPLKPRPEGSVTSAHPPDPDRKDQLMTTRIEIELPDYLVARYRRANPSTMTELESIVLAALPPAPIRVEIELGPNVPHLLPTDPDFYEVGITMTETTADILNSVVAALLAREDA